MGDDLGKLSRGISNLSVDLLDLSCILRQLLEYFGGEAEQERDRQEIRSVKESRLGERRVPCEDLLCDHSVTC
jgi:hypothetical protein